MAALQQKVVAVQILANVAGQARATSMFLGATDATPTTNSDVKLHVDGDAQVTALFTFSCGFGGRFHIVASEKVEPGRW